MNRPSAENNPELPPMQPETDQDLVDTDLYDAPEPVIDITDTGAIVATDHEGSLLRGHRRRLPPAPSHRTSIVPILWWVGSSLLLGGVLYAGSLLVGP
ncbi:MAG: hypothetical protein AAF602_24130 [Myxococcota bacterium]